MPVDVLHHDNRVVHHQADGQHHGQQGQQVERVAHHLHEEQHADHRQRNGHHRDQHRTQGTEEQEHHHDDDQYCLAERLDHFVDGGLDEQRGVVGDGYLQRRGQLAFQLGHDAPHFLDDVQRVGGRCGLDADVYRWGAVERADRVVVFRPHLDPCHIAQQHAAVAAGLDRQGGERLGRLQLGAGVDAGDHVFALHLAGRGKEVVAAHGIGPVVGRQAIACQFHRVDPDAHGEHLVAEDFRFGHARQSRQLGLDHPRQVVGDLRVAHFLAVETDVHQRRGIGGFLAQYRVFRVLGQLVAHFVGLGQQFGEQAVAVGADACVDGYDREVLPAHRGHVVDAFGTGQALLQRLGDIALDGFGVGAGVGGGHRDQGG